MTAVPIEQASGFVDRLEPAVRDELLVGRRRRFAAQSTLLFEGDRPLDVVVVRSGVLKVSTNIGGREVVLDILGPGDIAGELAALDGRVRSASVVAMTVVEVDVIPTYAFMAFLAARPYVAMTLLRLVATRLRDASRRQVEYGALTPWAAVPAPRRARRPLRASRRGWRAHRRPADAERHRGVGGALVGGGRQGAAVAAPPGLGRHDAARHHSCSTLPP